MDRAAVVRLNEALEQHYLGNADHREERNGQAGGDVQDPEGRKCLLQALLRAPVPLAKKFPGLRKYEVSEGPVATPAGPSQYHLVATLHFDDLAALKKALAGPEAKAAVADVKIFATGGV